jgi:hypothetical protein
VSGLDERLRDLTRRHNRNTESSSTVGGQKGAISPLGRIRRAAEEYLEAAVDRRTATRPQAHHGIRCRATEEGFTLDCGDSRLLTAILEADAWHVTIWNASGTMAEHVYESDDGLLGARNALLQLLEAGSQRSGAGRQQIGNEIKTPRSQLVTDRLKARVKATLTTRRAGLSLYIIAFGIGLAFSVLLAQHARLFADHGEVRRPTARSLVGRISQPPRNPFHHPGQVALQRRASGSVSLRASPSTTTLPHRPLSSRTLDRVVRPAPKISVSVEPPFSLFVVPAADDSPDQRDSSQTAEGDIRFHVQAGMFSSHEDAEVLVQRLRSLGYAVSLHEGAPYRVFVGGYFDRPTAGRLAENLRKAGFAAVLEP